MTNRQIFIYMTILIVLFGIIEQTYEVYLDCTARCMLRKHVEHNSNTLQKCQDECDLFKLLEKEDATEGKHFRYKLF